MQIKKLSVPELELELKRARFWIEQASIGKSIELIEKMDSRCSELLSNEVVKPLSQIETLKLELIEAENKISRLEKDVNDLTYCLNRYEEIGDIHSKLVDCSLYDSMKVNLFLKNFDKYELDDLEQ